MPTTGLFLRTAQTEDRIKALEDKMDRIFEILSDELEDAGKEAYSGMEKTDDPKDLRVSGLQPPDGSDADAGPVGQPAAVVREVRRERDAPRVQAASHRGKRSR